MNKLWIIIIEVSIYYDCIFYRQHQQNNWIHELHIAHCISELISFIGFFVDMHRKTKYGQSLHTLED